MYHVLASTTDTVRCSKGSRRRQLMQNGIRLTLFTRLNIRILRGRCPASRRGSAPCPAHRRLGPQPRRSPDPWAGARGGCAAAARESESEARAATATAEASAADGTAVESSESDALARHAAQQRHERASEARAATATAEANAADGTAGDDSEHHDYEGTSRKARERRRLKDDSAGGRERFAARLIRRPRRGARISSRASSDPDEPP